MGVEIATPGEILGVIEEFSPGQGVYEESGNVYASMVGEVVKDVEERKISVVPMRRAPLMPRRGDVVRGVVMDVRKDVADIDLYEVEGLRFYATPFKAILHVSEVDVGFVDRMLNALWPGDVVRAKVIAIRDSYLLTLKGRGLGVVLALCSRCRSPLPLKGSRLICLTCGSQELRKTSLSHYLLRLGRAELKPVEGMRQPR
jgi:exosome complex component CSL4